MDCRVECSGFRKRQDLESGVLAELLTKRNPKWFLGFRLQAPYWDYSVRVWGPSF